MSVACHDNLILVSGYDDHRGVHYLVTDVGTYNPGHGAFARTVWRAATQTDSDNANA
jgi:hypothetical protein